MKIDLDKVLNLKVNHDGCKYTLRTYFRDMLLCLWDEGESFSGKRPLGNSDWETPIFVALIKGGFIEGNLDEDAYAFDFDERLGRKIVKDAIKHMGKPTMTVIPKEPAWRPGDTDPAPISPAPESLKGKADERPVKSRQAVKATLPPREQLEPHLTHTDDFKP